MIRTDLYNAMTPFGAVAIDFLEECGATFDGPLDAIDHLVAVMSQCTNGVGASITPGNLEPSALVNFCQPAGSLVTIVLPLP